MFKDPYANFLHREFKRASPPTPIVPREMVCPLERERIAKAETEEQWKRLVKSADLDIKKETTASSATTRYEILRATVRATELPASALQGTVRKADLVKARQIYCWVARRFTQSSLPLIARSIKRDHSTVLYAIERVDQVICDLNLFSDAARTAEQWIEALWAADWSGQSQRRGRP